MIETGPFTFRIIETHVGYAVVRTEASGYELIWEVGLTKKQAADRCRTLRFEHREVA